MPNDDLAISSLVELIQGVGRFRNAKEDQLRKIQIEQQGIIEECERSIRARSQAQQLRTLNDQYRDAFTRSRDANASAEEKEAAEGELENLHKRVIEMAQRVADEGHDPQIVSLINRKQAAEEEIKSVAGRLGTLTLQCNSLHIPKIESLYGALFDRSKIADRQNTANELRGELKFFSDSIQPGRGGDPAAEAMHAELLKYVSWDLINRTLAAYGSSAPALVVPAAASSSLVASEASSAAPALVVPEANSSAMALNSGSVVGSSASYVPDESKSAPSARNSIEMLELHPRSS